MLKKIISLLLVLAILTLSACGTIVESDTETEPSTYVEYKFKSEKLLKQHYEKHGIDMGFASAEEYEKAASDVINNPDALSKLEKEDGDGVFYIEDTNEFAILSTEGYIRTYFLPDAGKAYFDKQQEQTW